MTRFDSHRRAEFEATILPFLGVAYRTARRLTRGTDEAKDLTQDAMLRAFRSFDQFRPGTNGKAWLLAITYTVFVNRYRQRQRDPLVAVEDLEQLYDATLGRPAAPPPAEPAPPGAISEPEIEQALGELPEVYRSAVLLVDVEELTYEEAAGVLQCPVNTVRSRLSRGRKLLCVSLREYAERAGLLGKEEPRRR